MKYEVSVVTSDTKRRMKIRRIWTILFCYRRGQPASCELDQYYFVLDRLYFSQYIRLSSMFWAVPVCFVRHESTMTVVVKVVSVGSSVGGMLNKSQRLLLGLFVLLLVDVIWVSSSELTKVRRMWERTVLLWVPTCNIFFSGIDNSA